jgi:hypothetical protein
MTTVMAIEIPKIVRITRGKLNSRIVRWGTDIEFENGVMLMFTGKLKDADATTEATSMYRSMRQAGWTDAEIVAMYKPEGVSCL